VSRDTLHIEIYHLSSEPTIENKRFHPFFVVSVRAAVLEKDMEFLKINNYNMLSYVSLLGLNFNTFGRRKWREEPMWWIAPIVTKVWIWE
jgi:hypothetical protein